jgi:hypothetical protein
MMHLRRWAPCRYERMFFGETAYVHEQDPDHIALEHWLAVVLSAWF